MPVSVMPSHIREAAYGLAIPEGSQVDAAIERLIEKATDRVYAAFPNLDDWISTGTLTAARVQGVIEDMVIRVLRNPNAYRQVSIDDYARMIDTALSTGALYLSPEERALLTPRRKRSAIGSVRLAVPSWRLPRA